MLRVSFKGPLKRSLGFEEIEIEGGKLENVLKKLSENLGVEFERDGTKLKMIADVGGKKVKFSITLHYNGKNVLREGIEELNDGILEVITPMGGG